MRSRKLASLAMALAIGVIGLALVFPEQAQALTVTCSNGDSLSPPYNLLDRCPVSTVDRNTTFLAEMTGGEAACDPVRHTTHTQRVRVVGDYQAALGGKFLIRSIDIRYLRGTQPWAYYRVHVQDGNGQYFWRSWNNYGDPIYWDGASTVVENTVHITPNSGFAPVFGGRRYIQIYVYPHFFKYPNFWAGQVCHGDYVVVRLTAP
jgi:hypothetical protein